MRHSTFILLLTLLAAGAAPAQSTNVVADAPPDYSTFSSFIATRNIFNPDRYPVRGNSSTHHHHTPTGAPFIALVGTMNYQKGMFAFFNGNPAENRKVLQNNEQIAGYTVKEITPGGVVMTSSASNTVRLSIGAQLRQDGTNWELVASSDAQAAPPDTSASPTEDTSTPAPTAPDPNSAPNDIIKRLMEKRAQEMK